MGPRSEVRGPRESPREDLSEYGKNKQRSELDSLTSKREAINRAKLANIKPKDDEPRLLTANDNNDNDNISHDELQQLLQQLQKEKDNEKDNEDDLFAMQEFKTRRIVNQQRGLSSGNYGGDATTITNSNNNNNSVSGSSNDENDTNSNYNATTEGEEEEGHNNLFIIGQPTIMMRMSYIYPIVSELLHNIGGCHIGICGW